MKTAEIAGHLAAAAGEFPFLGKITADDLLALVRVELGHEGALDDFQPHGGHLAKASGPGTILHVISGNTPAAGLQTLIRGLLLGSHNLCKLPSAGLPQLAAFRSLLPPTLASHVELSPDLPESWLAKADAVIVFGSDETIAHFRGRMRPEQRFVAHGHRLSFAVVFEDSEFASVPGAARDVLRFDQLGCLSPQTIFVRGDARKYAARLDEEIAAVHADAPRSELLPAEAAAIRALRSGVEFRAANDSSVAIWASPGTTEWTVVNDEAQIFPESPLSRVVFVRSLPRDLAPLLAPFRLHLSAAGIWPATLDNARQLAELGVSRICPLGKMQLPPLTWHQDGTPVLSALVSWVDCEEG